MMFAIDMTPSMKNCKDTSQNEENIFYKCNYNHCNYACKLVITITNAQFVEQRVASCLAPALGVTMFKNIREMIWAHIVVPLKSDLNVQKPTFLT
jgi:hypothetical protein